MARDAEAVRDLYALLAAAEAVAKRDPSSTNLAAVIALKRRVDEVRRTMDAQIHIGRGR